MGMYSTYKQDVAVIAIQHDVISMSENVVCHDTTVRFNPILDGMWQWQGGGVHDINKGKRANLPLFPFKAGQSGTG